MPLKRAVLIAGPTASGKSSLALKIARERNGVIINADAMQVYRELRVLTARPTADEERAAPHLLYGHVSGTEAYSVARWLGDARDALERCWNEGRLPIVTGGTGLYFRALEQGIAEIPAIPSDIRERWRQFEGDLAAELRRRDPDASVNANDRQRLVRALEVIDATGKPLREWQALAHGEAALAGVAVERHYLDVPRAELHERAERRFDSMMEQGALAEVRSVVHLDPELPMMRAIGVPELKAHLEGQISLEQAVADAKAATRQYIKRQATWWRGQMKHWRNEQVS